MSVETGSGTQGGVPWGARLDSSRGFVGLGVRRRPTPQGIAEARGPAACMRRDALYRRSLLVADVVALAGALVLTIALSSRRVPLHLTWESMAGVPMLLLGAKLMGLYDRDETLLRKTTLDEAPKLFQLATLSVLVAWLAGRSVIAGALDRKEALFLWLALAGLLILARATARMLALRIGPAERCLFIGDERSAGMIRAKLSGHGGIRAKMVAHLDLDKAAPWSTDSLFAPKLAEIRDLARSLDVHRAIVAPGWDANAEPGQVLNLVRTLKAVGVRVSVLPRMLEVVGSSVEFDDLHGVTLMGVRRFDLTRSSAAVKRAFDLLGASLGLLAVTPLMLVIAVAIKLDSRGPVFFRQLRVGRHGERFQMLKFRTMVPDAEAMKDSLRDRNEAREGLFKIAEDPRVTHVGRFLRKSALDELPQLLNIARGEMSLVGPRPLVIEEDRRVEGWHRRRLELTPGMTGHWQILGPARVPLGEMVAIDYLYVANWSLWTDVKILLRTVPHVIGRRGL
ncbi:MAG TPA: exopolysaccharide biosynthesis polyprenyl glycosylphosphotransferase [Solirubrobacteraceae bacterium]|jgi:exopolysaccharide biosynthesis polyprenyl glycosylphosphotransferase|nr:exopolysaccharide biosynthesis polyprenyl glycosylphosphotransferase [Solirubrobacteraceae bacterium]